MDLNPDQLAQSICNGDVRALSKAITLCESTLRSERNIAESLIAKLYPLSDKTIKIGVTGVPGVGKSSFIESVGMELIRVRNLRVAVLAIDPSSPVHGGSILGDKTRMYELSRSSSAFVRPSPSGSNSHGGIGRYTNEASILCAAAGYDVLFVESVGVGQSEYALRDLVDVLILLHMPGSGDDLQAAKKGILEVVDACIVHKWDGTTKDAAEQALLDLRGSSFIVNSLGYKRADFAFSSVSGAGKKEWNEFFDTCLKGGTKKFESLRLKQRKKWFLNEQRAQLLERFIGSETDESARILLNKVESGEIPASTAAALWVSEIKLFLG